MSSKEEKIPLVVQSDYLPTLELGHRGEQGLEQSPDRMSKAGHKAIQHELGEMLRRTRMSLEKDKYVCLRWAYRP